MTNQDNSQESSASHAEEDHAITQTFHSDRFDLDVKTSPKCRVTLHIKAKIDLLKDAKKDALKQVSKEVSIPGFRKGKAPANLIETKYPGAINKAWDSSFADIAFKEAQILANIPVLNNSAKISYQVTSLQETDGEVSFQFEREPLVPLIDYSVFSIKEGVPTDVTLDNIKGTIRGIQMFYAKWNQVSDRAVKEEDFVVLDIDDLDQDPPVQAFSGSRFEVREGKMAAWMRLAVIGKNLNESVEAVSEPDANETELHIRGIEEAILPEVDDEFSKRVGAPNIEALHIQLKNLLTKQALENWKISVRESISDQILEKIHFEIPASMLEKEANFRLSELFKQPAFLKKWKSEMTEEEKEGKKAEVITQAEHAIRLFYICRTILSDNNVEISEDDLTPNYETLLEMMFADPHLVNYKNQSREQQAVEFSKYMMSKAQDFIIAKISPQKI
jgi:trigger factor